MAEVKRLRAIIATQHTMLGEQRASLQRLVHPPLQHALSPEWSAIFNQFTTRYSPARVLSSSAPVPPTYSPTSSLLQTLSCDLHNLYASFFVHSPYHLALVQPGTAFCIDTNHSFLAYVGLPRDRVVGKRITLSPAVYLLLERGDHILPDEFMGGRGMDCGRERQASNWQSLERLYGGAEETVVCVFRYILGDERVVDARCRCWLMRGWFSGVVEEMPWMIVQSSEDDYVTVTA